MRKLMTGLAIAAGLLAAACGDDVDREPIDGNAMVICDEDGTPCRGDVPAPAEAGR
ncbi:hypothetical protein ABC347_10975 [Sphingomonas sp. 1P06PA]|uniref:hypothetical protein n=1 Tax=Sphingomonas sp. 1P06PA TaxID=554121 RepID=UPI0039A78533